MSATIRNGLQFIENMDTNKEYDPRKLLDPRVITYSVAHPTKKRRKSRFLGGCLQLSKGKRMRIWYLHYNLFDGTGKAEHHSLRVGTLEDYPTRAAADKAAEPFREQIRQGLEAYLHRPPIERLNKKFVYNMGQYQEMFAAQGGKCAICGDAHPRLHVDHCHATGAMRQLLCGHCNKALGLLRDNPAFCESAAAYLRKHGR
jgi:hypothetical protein